MKIYKPSYAHKGGIVWSKPSKISKPWDKSSLRKEKKPAAQGKKIQALGTNRNGDGKRNARVGLLRMLMLKDCNVLELVDNFGFLISFFFDKFIC